MTELLGQRKQELLESSSDGYDNNEEKQGIDIIQSMLKSCRPTVSSRSSNDKRGAGLPLSDAEIIGNAFVLILAGHETSGDVLHFALLHLALNPSAQLALQADLDRIAGVTAAAEDGVKRPRPRPRPSWDQVCAMLSGMPGAVVNETMRFMPPVVQIPKHTSGDQRLVVSAGDAATSVECVVPDGTIVQLVAVSAHRHPRYWPPAPGGASDADEWIPERWFRPTTAAVATTTTTTTTTTSDRLDYDTDDDDDDNNDDYMSAMAFRPTRGAFLPFSDGARSCLGRRMAQVEMVAALATLMGSHSIELAVDDFVADDDEVGRMSVDQRRELYGRVSERARRVIGEAYSVITLKLQDGARVPVRIVPRGQERFVGVV